MTQEPVSPAEEAIVAAMFGGLIVCVVASYIALRAIGEWTTPDVIVLSIGSFVLAGYILPRVVAWWFGRSLYDIFGSPPRLD